MTTDQTGKPAPVAINLIPGDVAPRYVNAFSADLVRAVITEQGMASNLPLVDLVCRTADGHSFVVTTSGRLILAIAAAIRGANERNHGKAEP